MTVAVRLVDPGDRRPVLVGIGTGREDRDLTRVRAVPVADDRAGGVRCAPQRRLVRAPLPPLDLLNRFTHASATVPAFSREWGDDYFSRTAMPALRVPDFNMSSVSQAQ